MSDILKPDLCIIGAGSGGLTVAAAARAFDASVVLVERSRMGGDCLNTGCVPSKSLIAASKAAQTFRTSAKFGVAEYDPEIDFAKVHDHVHGVIATIAPHDSVERFRGLGVDVIEAEGRFIDPKTLEAGGKQIQARRFVIATGSRAAVPPIDGLADVPYLTNETIFDLTRRPDHLVVVGGGPIGVELAQAHRRLGSDVTVIEMAEPLANEDRELVDIALRALKAEGVTILSGTKVLSVAGTDTGISVATQNDGEAQTVEGSHLLIATGRTPTLEALDLDAAKVRHDGRGIKVNKGLRSSNRRIYAIGDAAGGLMFTHVAGYHAGLVVRNALFGLPVRENRDILPRATYTDPEVAQIGLTESEARKRLGDKIMVLRWSYAENDRAQAEKRTEGLVKVITNRKGRILGAGAVGPHSGELICFYALAIANKLDVGAFVKFVAPYPTYTEVAKRVAVEYYRDKLENPWLKRLMALNRLLP